MNGYLVVALTSADAEAAKLMKQRLEYLVPGITAVIITGAVSAIYVPGGHEAKVVLPELSCELCGTNIDLTQVDKRVLCMTCASEYQ